MTDHPTLTLSDDQFHSLWATVHKSRSTSTTISLDKQAVVNMLLDHSRMYNEVFPHRPSDQHREPRQ